MSESVKKVMDWTNGKIEVPKMGLEFKYIPKKGYRRKSMVGFTYCPWCGKVLR